MKRAILLAALFAAGLIGGPVLAFDLQGHRGARGLLPENTLPAFAKALDIGVTTLELDLAMTADGDLVVSHNPRLNSALTRSADGKWLAEEGPAIWSLTTAAVKGYDVGRLNPEARYARQFPQQQAVDGTAIPTLAEVIALVSSRKADHVRFNVETKIRPDRPDETPSPEAFADALVAFLRHHKLELRAAVQSFDWRTLGAVQKWAPNIPTVYLSAQQPWLDNIKAGDPGSSPWTNGYDIDDYDGSVPKAIKAAGGKVWSPYWKDLTETSLKEAHDAGLTVIVWTVDNVADMERMMDLGVDGIITDYPDRLKELLDKRGFVRDPNTGDYLPPKKG